MPYIKSSTVVLINAHMQMLGPRACIVGLEIAQMQPLTRVRLQVPCEHMGAVFVLLEQHGIRRLAEHYNEDGSMQLRLGIQISSIEAVQSEFLNATGGQVTLVSCHEGES